MLSAVYALAVGRRSRWEPPPAAGPAAASRATCRLPEWADVRRRVPMHRRIRERWRSGDFDRAPALWRELDGVCRGREQDREAERSFRPHAGGNTDAATQPR